MSVYLSRNYAGDPMIFCIRPTTDPKKQHELTAHRDSELHVALWKAANNIEPQRANGEFIDGVTER